MFKRFLTKKDSYRKFNFYTPSVFAFLSFLFSRVFRYGMRVRSSYYSSVP